MPANGCSSDHGTSFNSTSPLNRSSFIALTRAFGLASTVLKAGDQDFGVINRTGLDIPSIHVAPHSRYEWDDDILGKDTVGDGEEVESVFPRKDKAANWDLRVEDEDNKSYVWENLNLLKISEVTPYYRKGVATATSK